LNIPQTGRNIALTPSPDGTPDPFSDAGEVTLDAETVAGLAPGANISIYGMPGLNAQNFTDTVNAITTANSASVISFSAGGCEYSGITTDPVFQAAADAGIAVIASAGDEGNVCGSNLNVGVNHPASDPYITGLGGSETERPDFDLTSNTVWNDEACGQQCGGGGGVSQYFTLPSYQQGLPGAASTSFRNVPDVAMPAMSTAVYQGDWELIGGTSWSAPEYAALMAELYQYCNSKVQDPVVIPYYVQQQDKTALIDVIHGDNQFNNTTPFYAAGTGYDNASGVGVPLGMKYSNVVCPGRSFATSSIRRRTTVQRMSVARPAEAYAVNVTPRVRNLIDEGRRPFEAQTRIQIAVRYGAGAAAGESAVIDSLQKAGFTIVRTFRNHLVVDAVAPSGTVESFFRTELHNVQQSGHNRYMPVRQVVVPANLAPYVAAVNLDDVITMRHKITRYAYGLQL